MVEGPGCALCAERLRARLRRGQRVRAARGGAVRAPGQGQGGERHGPAAGTGTGRGEARPGHRDADRAGRGSARPPGQPPGAAGPSGFARGCPRCKCRQVWVRAGERAGTPGCQGTGLGLVPLVPSLWVAVCVVREY